MRIIPRTDWGAQHGRGTADPGPEPRVVLHHSFRPALNPQDTPAAEATAIRAIERFHVRDNGWDGIGYNFLVAPSGRVYEGRGWRFRGAHAGPVNGSSIGICLLIDGSVTEPNEELIHSVRDLIRTGLELGEISATYTVSGHRDHMEGRTCPGDKVYRRLQEFRHDAGAEVEAVVPDVAISPPSGPPMYLTRIELPTPAHVDEILRVRRLSPAAARAGLTVAEVLLRGVLGGRTAGVKAAADAVADWLKRQ